MERRGARRSRCSPGAFWAAYILLSARAGQAFPGGSGLTLGHGGRQRVLLPFGIAEGGADLLDPEVLLVGAGVAMLSSAIPYSLELEALRRLPAHVFGVLMSLEPGMAALAGFVVLGRGAGRARGGGDRAGGGGERGSGTCGGRGQATGGGLGPDTAHAVTAKGVGGREAPRQASSTAPTVRL